MVVLFALVLVVLVVRGGGGKVEGTAVGAEAAAEVDDGLGVGADADLPRGGVRADGVGCGLVVGMDVEVSEDGQVRAERVDADRGVVGA